MTKRSRLISRKRSRSSSRAFRIRRKRTQRGGFSLPTNLKAVTGAIKPAASKFTTQVVKPAAGVVGKKLLEFSQSKSGTIAAPTPIVAVAAIKTSTKPATVVSASATGKTPEAALKKAVETVQKGKFDTTYHPPPPPVPANAKIISTKKIPTYVTPKYGQNYVSPYRQPGKKGGRRHTRRTKRSRKHTKRH